MKHHSEDQEQVYTAEQVADILGISIRQAYYLCNATNNFRVIRVSPRCVRIHKDSFDAWFHGTTGNKEY